MMPQNAWDVREFHWDNSANYLIHQFVHVPQKQHSPEKTGQIKALC
jgi:hypothetical protein